MSQNYSNQNSGCNRIQIVQTSAKVFFARLFYANTGEPFDLTGVTEIVAIFPGLNGSVIKKTLSDSGGVIVVGSPGAGKVQISLSTTDTQQMQPNTQIAQNLQFIVTIGGVAQIDVLSFAQSPVSGTAYTIILNGASFSYIASSGDTAEDVFDALASLILEADNLITPFVSGIADSAELSLTSSVPGLGFTDAVSSGITLTNGTANGGVRSVVLIQQALNIYPQDYSGD